MFSAISATRFAILDAMIVYGEACCWRPFAAPLAVLWVFFPAVEAAFFGREALLLADVRFTGADATEAGILGLCEVGTGVWDGLILPDVRCRVQGEACVEYTVWGK